MFVIKTQLIISLVESFRKLIKSLVESFRKLVRSKSGYTYSVSFLLSKNRKLSTVKEPCIKNISRIRFSKNASLL